MFENVDDLSRIDLRLLQNGAVSLFWSKEILKGTCTSIADFDYSITTIRCDTGWTGFQEQMSAVLKWEEQFGYGPWNGNLDALNDGMRGYPFPTSKRAALVLLNFQMLVQSDKRSSHDVLDIFEYNARDHLLFGNTLIVLVQTDDDRFESRYLGGRPAMWNPDEWSIRSRGSSAASARTNG